MTGYQPPSPGSPAPSYGTPIGPGSEQPPEPSSQLSPRDLDDAKMVAIQIAASGGTRGAVREHLHRALGISQTTGILDEVFGQGTGEDARVPWISGRP